MVCEYMDPEIEEYVEEKMDLTRAMDILSEAKIFSSAISKDECVMAADLALECMKKINDLSKVTKEMDRLIDHAMLQKNTYADGYADGLLAGKSVLKILMR